MSDLGWYGRTWYDRRQNEQIESMADRLAAQRAEARRAAQKLSTVTGNLSDRVDRLTTAFESFVELSDLREELRAFDREAEVRQHARRILRQLVAAQNADAGTVRVQPPPAADGPGNYWLPGALAALVAAFDRQPDAAVGDLATARSCDPMRTDVFLTIGLLVSRRPDEAADLLPNVLDFRPDQPVTRAQRELWRAAAAGAFGPAGHARLVERLATLVTGLAGEARTAEVIRWRGVVDQLPAPAATQVALPRRITLPPQVLASAQAVGRLEALADWHQQALAAVAGGPDAPLSTQVEDALRAHVQELVDEGSPDERPLLQRLAQLRRVIEANGGAPSGSREHWDDPIDTPLALLAADVNGADPMLKAVAAQAGAALITAVADDLATAAVQPLPDRVDVRIGRHKIRYRTMGVDPTSLAETQTSVMTLMHRSNALPASVGWAALGVGVVLLVVFAVAGLIGIGLLALLVGGGLGGYILLTDNQARVEEQAMLRRRQSEWHDSEKHIRQVESALADLRQRAQSAAATVPGTRARLDPSPTPAPDAGAAPVAPAAPAAPAPPHDADLPS
jgi:hypothetical protein